MENSYQPHGGITGEHMSGPQVEPPAARIINLREHIQFNDQHPQARILAESQGTRLVGFALRAGQEIKEHSSPGQLLVQAIEGELLFTVANQSFCLRAGMVLQIAAGVTHYLRATEDARMLLVIIPDRAQGNTESRDRR